MAKKAKGRKPAKTLASIVKKTAVVASTPTKKLALKRVMFCACVHNFQDKHYGKRKRLHNLADGVRAKGYRCTVCGTVKPL